MTIETLLFTPISYNECPYSRALVRFRDGRRAAFHGSNWIGSVASRETFVLLHRLQRARSDPAERLLLRVYAVFANGFCGCPPRCKRKFDGFGALVGCSLLSGLLMQPLEAADPDGVGEQGPNLKFRL